MGKLLRRGNKSPDAEQLLTPRKNGFFGKRNNGVRSEDTGTEKSKSLSARRLVSSVFKSSSKKLDDHDNHNISPLEGSPAIHLDSGKVGFGTPKTAPPSPDLVVLAKSSSNMHGRTQHQQQHQQHQRHPRRQSNSSHLDGEETIMSDLTGTVSPNPPTAAQLNSMAQTAEERASGITPPVVSQPSVTFAETATQSFYSGYSPSLGVFRTESGNLVNRTPSDTNNHNGSNPQASKTNPKDENNGYCKSSVLDQVLGVVDGACQGWNSRRLNTGVNPVASEWGMAPSEDDESTNFDTFVSTVNPRTRDTTPTGTLCTGTGSIMETVQSTSVMSTVQEDTVATTTEATSTRPETTVKEGTLRPEGGSAPQKALHLPKVERKPSDDAHENFELVLGQTGLPTYLNEALAPKKRTNNWSILQNKRKGPEEEKKDDGLGASTRLQAPEHRPKDLFASKSPVPVKAANSFTSPLFQQPQQQMRTASSAPSSPIPSSKEQRDALFHSVFGDDFTQSPSRDVGVEITSKKILQQQQDERIAADKPPRSPSPKKGLSSLVKRLRFGKMRRSKSTSSVPPKQARDAVRSNSKAARHSITNVDNTSFKKGFVSPPPRPTMSPPPLQNAPAQFSPSAMAAVAAASPSIIPRNEEEKKEVESNDVNISTETPAPYQTPLRNDKTPRKSNLGNGPDNATLPEIQDLSPQPGPLKDRSNSFQLPKGRPNQAPPEPTSSKTAAVGPNKDTEANAGLKEPVNMTRLRSAPDKMPSSESLESKERKLGQPKEQDKTGKDKANEGGRRKPPKLTWKAAQDDQGRTYYYHRETRKTQWVKPAAFDAELAAVKRYKEEMEAAKKEASETQQVVDEYKSVEAIQAQLRKKTQRDFDPKVWQTKQEILDIVKSMPLPNGTNIEKLLVQYDGREEQLLANLRDLVESKPFDEPFQAPRRADPPARKRSTAGDQGVDSNLNISHASSFSSSNLHAVDVQHRVRTAVSASTRISEKTYLTEKTEKIRNTSNKLGIDTIREGGGAMSTGSISSASENGLPPRNDSLPFKGGRVPSKIPAVPRSRDLKVEEFASDRIAKETFNGEGMIPPTTPKKEATENDGQGGGDHLPSRRPSADAAGGAKAVAEQIVALSSLDDDDDSYNGDFEETVDDRGNETASEKMGTDSISALSEGDVDYLAQKENFERARRRALDVAVEREDWDLAAALSEGMKQVKESLYGKPVPQREWTQTELDRFISENDWDAVSKYIAHMRDHPSAGPSSSASHTGSRQSNGVLHAGAPRGRDPSTGRDPDGHEPPKRTSPSSPHDEVPPSYVSEASKRAAAHTQSARRQQQDQLHNTSAENSITDSQGSGMRAQTRFGARSQLQHSDLTSISSWGDSSSSYDSEYTENSYESEDEHGYISLRVRRNEFEC